MLPDAPGLPSRIPSACKRLHNPRWLAPKAGILGLLGLTVTSLSSLSGSAASPKRPGVSAAEAGITPTWQLFRYADHYIFLAPPSVFVASNMRLYAVKCPGCTKGQVDRNLTFYGLHTEMVDRNQKDWELTFKDPTIVESEVELKATAGAYTLYCGSSDPGRKSLSEIRTTDSPNDLKTTLLQHARFVQDPQSTDYLLRDQNSDEYIYLELDADPNLDPLSGLIYTGPLELRAKASTPSKRVLDPLPRFLVTGNLGRILLQNKQTGGMLNLKWLDSAKPPTGGVFTKKRNSSPKNLDCLPVRDEYLALLSAVIPRRKNMPCNY